MNKVEYRKILIVEDNDELRERLSVYFSKMNEVAACATLQSAERTLAGGRFDIILLDVILPDGNGLKILEQANGTPVIVLSDLGEDANILEGLSAGAIDYIVKPASEPVIEARMSLRLLPREEATISHKGLVVDLAKRTAAFENTHLNLTSSEFNILTFLMQNAGTFYTAVEIYEKVWKMPHLNTTTIKAHLSNLRKKMLNAHPRCAELIITEFGKGYAFGGSNDEN